MVQMKEQFTCLIILAMLVCSLTGCFPWSINKRISSSLGISIPLYLKIEYEDTHGGFHGDGVTLAKVRFKGKDAENVLSQIRANDNWKRLPLSDNVELEMYGGKKDAVVYESDLAEKLDMPKIQNGYWIFIDRFNNETRVTDGEGLFPRYSANYTLGIYDTDSSILYYCKFDS